MAKSSGKLAGRHAAIRKHEQQPRGQVPHAEHAGRHQAVGLPLVQAAGDARGLAEGCGQVSRQVRLCTLPGDGLMQAQLRRAYAQAARQLHTALH